MVGDRPILDPCCGTRMMWFDKNNPLVLFGDKRSERLTVCDRSGGKQDGTRKLIIEPDLRLDFTALPFVDETFQLVAFDPPHLVNAGAKSWLGAKYGKLTGDWKHDLWAGFRECFRVLRSGGVLVFKWNETQVRASEILALVPQQPLFGHRSGAKGLTHWFVFMKETP